jgi:hypothetical protein
MRAPTLRRAGFAATLLTGLALTGSAVHGLAGMDTKLQVAATTVERPVLVSDHHRAPGHRWLDCERPREKRRI